jgi:hypothetical protein
VVRWLLSVSVLVGIANGRGDETLAAEPAIPELPPSATVRVDFDTHIKPILESRCVKCHARGKLKGGLSLETREALLEGGEEGPAAVVGKSEESLLISLVAGLEPDRRMPDRGEALSRDDVRLLRAWIDQGLTWPKGFSFGFRQAPLAPRRPPIPQDESKAKLDHPIDRFIARDLAERGAKLDWNRVPDRLFLRRASLDLVGLLPTPKQYEHYENDRRPGKEARLVEALLADRDAYADHWLTFWNDALRNSYRGTGFIDGGRITITQWLYRALYENTPYDRFVHDLVSPVPGSEGFTKGIVWRGVVNASQVPPVQAAQNISQVFLGTNLKCASCHDSFVNHWKLTDAYALAAVFSDQPLEINRCDKPTGKTSSIGFIYPQLGTIDSSAPRPDRMRQLADLLVKPENGRFARTIVNRLWAQLMGRGIVEPLDDMDQLAWNQDLLDWLASDLVEHKYDIKHTLALICTSRAYRLPSVGVDEPGKRGAYVFRGPLTKRMTAEQFSDAVSSLTGIWPQASGDMLKVDGRGQGGQVTAVRSVVAADRDSPSGAPAKPTHVDATWVWSHADAERDPGGRILLRKVIKLDKVPEKALALATCDNEVALFINNRPAGQSSEWTQPLSVDITSMLRVGENVIAIEATNWPDVENKRGTQVTEANPAAVIAWVGGFKGDQPVWGYGTDSSWLWIKKAKGDWKGPSYETSGWNHATELPSAPRLYGASVNLDTLVAHSLATKNDEPVRAALAFDDPLMSAMGRTSREQVVTRRDPIATTLQALELTNGTTLDAKLKKGAQRWLTTGKGNDPDGLIRSVFQIGLGRAPSPREVTAARDVVGRPATVEGIQDLLWAVAMLPEFQLID